MNKRQGVLFKRFFSVIILTILMTAVFTTCIYTYISRSVFTSIKENELLPRARALAHLLSEPARLSEQTTLWEMLSPNEESESLLGAYAIVTDRAGAIRFSSRGVENGYLSAVAQTAEAVRSQGELRTVQIPALRHSSMVGVGVSIEADGAYGGAVFLLVPLYEAMVAMGSLNGALLLSVLAALPFVTALVFYVIGRIVTPLRQMRDVAIHMAQGDFAVRADTSQRGELGQMGESLNYLSQELSRSISALVLERNRLQRTLDGLREGIVAVDRELRVTHFNPAIRQLFATMPKTDAKDENMQLIPSRDVWDSFERATITGEAVVKILPLADRTLQLSVTPLTDERKNIAGAVGLVSDVTESERLERTRRDYVANVSHEMRTPLTAMRALLEPLSEGMVTAEDDRRRYYSIMLRETMRLTRLINDLMELSRLQSGTLSVHMEWVDIREILDELSSKYLSTAEEHGLQYEVRIRDDCPKVWSNADRLEQLLVILLDNAMKYTPEGGTVAIDGQWDERQVVLSVADTGVGIDPKDQPYVFDRFYKVDKAHSELGSGLGLSIASEIVKRMREKIWLESTPGAGSTFFFTVGRTAREE